MPAGLSATLEKAVVDGDKKSDSSGRAGAERTAAFAGVAATTGNAARAMNGTRSGSAGVRTGGGTRPRHAPAAITESSSADGMGVGGVGVPASDTA